MAIDRNRLGREAEQQAVLHLQRAGYEIVLRNFRCRMGELDIVARRRDVLVIAEVRLRSRLEFGDAAASLTARKRARIVRAVRYLLCCQPPLARLTIRFDALLMDAAGGPILWIQDAF